MCAFPRLLFDKNRIAEFMCAIRVRVELDACAPQRIARLLASPDPAFWKGIT